MQSDHGLHCPQRQAQLPLTGLEINDENGSESFGMCYKDNIDS